jgi:nucleotide-binding universal stress UspA family protein
MTRVLHDKASNYFTRQRLLGTVRPPPRPRDPARARAGWQSHHRTDLESVRLSLQAELPEAARDAELLIRTGSAPHILADIAKERDCDLIVTGIARYNSWGDYILGTLVDYIVRHGTTPVLVVRQRPFEPYRRLIVATDFSEGSLWALLTAAALFPDLSITLVHAWHVPFEGFLRSEDTRQGVAGYKASDMEKFMANTAIPQDIRARITPVNDEGGMVQVLIRHIKSPRTDLLVIGSHGISGYAHATLGSTAAAILSGAHGDVLVVRKRRH